MWYTAKSSYLFRQKPIAATFSPRVDMHWADWAERLLPGWPTYFFLLEQNVIFFLQEQYVIAPDLKYHCFFASLKKVKLPAPKHRLLDNVCWTKVAAHILNTKWSNKAAYIVSDMPSLKTVRFLLGAYSVVLMQHYKGHEEPRPYHLCSKTETF